MWRLEGLGKEKKEYKKSIKTVAVGGRLPIIGLGGKFFENRIIVNAGLE